MGIMGARASIRITDVTEPKAGSIYSNKSHSNKEVSLVFIEM